MAKYLLKLVDRAVVLDPTWDYDNGDIIYDVREALDYLVDVRRGPFCLIFRGETIQEYETVMRMVRHMQQAEHMQNGPLALFFEESREYSDRWRITPELEKIYTRGRHWRINSVSVIQMDTAINPIIRASSQLIVTTLQFKLSTDYKSWFDPDAVRRLKPFTPLDGEPEQGKHFLLVPEYLNLYDEWERINAK